MLSNAGRSIVLESVPAHPSSLYSNSDKIEPTLENRTFLSGAKAAATDHRIPKK
jgi:hypothetical protein